MPPIPLITPVDLHALLLSPTPPAIIDVRDSDHIGGHIRTSQHVPSSTLAHAAPELARTLRDYEGVVVFHCALSQQRGPSAAARYAGERARLVGAGGGAGGGGGGEIHADVDEQRRRQQRQEILVLEGGFQAWQER